MFNETFPPFPLRAEWVPSALRGRGVAGVTPVMHQSHHRRGRPLLVPCLSRAGKVFSHLPSLSFFKSYHLFWYFTSRDVVIIFILNLFLLHIGK